ncbi:glucuronate isomerase, partial [Salmonella enterica subsp. enterica serovar Kentucky]|nr:glucuronate isomerase [Salmonella enterica subsp. enterica serovar Kentucky]
NISWALSRLLDSMDVTNELPKTILYCLNPRDNEVLATMIGNFITLPQLITTNTDMTAGLTSGKTTGSAEDFLALLAGALGADGA